MYYPRQIVSFIDFRAGWCLNNSKMILRGTKNKLYIMLFSDEAIEGKTRRRQATLGRAV